MLMRDRRRWPARRRGRAPVPAAVEDHWRYAESATVASGSIEMQRILLARSLAGGTMNIELSDEATSTGGSRDPGLRGRRRRRARPARRGRPDRARAARRARARPSWARGTSTPRRAATSSKPRPRCAAAPATGRSPYPVAERLARPDRPRRRRAARGRRRASRRRRSSALDLRWVAVAPRWSPQPASPAGRRRQAPRKSCLVVAELDLAPLDDVRRRSRRRRPRSGAPVLDAARHARPRDGADPRLRPRPRAVRPAAGVVPGRAVPAHRRRGRAGGVEELAKYALWSVAGSDAPRRSTTRWRCGRLRSRRPTSCSASPTSCTARSASATRRRCRGVSRYSQPLRRLPFGLAGTTRRTDSPSGPPTASPACSRATERGRMSHDDSPMC